MFDLSDGDPRLGLPAAVPGLPGLHLLTSVSSLPPVPHLTGAVLVGALLRVAPQHPAGLPHLQPSSDHRRTRCPHLAAHHPVPVAVHVEEVLALLAAQHHEAVAGCAVLLHVDHQPELAQELSTQSLT